jgi:hypothetical protein
VQSRTSNRSRSRGRRSSGGAGRKTRQSEYFYDKPVADEDLFLHGSVKDMAGDMALMFGAGVAAYLLFGSVWNVWHGKAPLPFCPLYEGAP